MQPVRRPGNFPGGHLLPHILTSPNITAAGLRAGLATQGQNYITKHLKKIFESGELDEKPVCALFAHTADDGKTYRYKFYALPALIAVGYRTNSQRAAQFRQ